MPLLLILLFPLAEIATFIVVGGEIGLTRTLALVVISFVVGVVMLRDAGAMTALKLQRRRGNQAAILAEGGTRMLAGLLLLIPGFLTDIAAILLLIPGFRRAIVSRLGRRANSATARSGNGAPEIIDGDFRQLDGEK